uniref:Sphingomyelin synthase 2b n=1 Tax=Sinocyclocheilus grahami TaxID=75366 RepID=A0A672KKU4_SINGR
DFTQQFVSSVSLRIPVAPFWRISAERKQRTLFCVSRSQLDCFPQSCSPICKYKLIILTQSHDSSSSRCFDRAIVGRRFFFLQGMLYLYRMVTMYITTLPVPSMHMHCAPKLYGDSHGKIERVLQLVSGAGLSITASHLMCGDFLYSGHTVMLTLTFLFIQEYSPRSLVWRCYHVICWLLSVVGVVCILMAHEHYSVDVVVAYFITSRLFYWYHTIANNQALRGSPHNYLNQTWWNRVFNFLEKNVKTTVPCTFSWPLSLPSVCFKNPCKSYSIVQSARDD